MVAPRYTPIKKTGGKKGRETLGLKNLIPNTDNNTPLIKETAYTLRIEAVLSNPVRIKKVSSPSHPVEVFLGKDKVVVNLTRENELLDSDFVLVVSLEEESRCRLTVGKHPEFGAFGLLELVPELDVTPSGNENYEYTFLIDVSGSMCGEKLTQAKRALRLALRNLMAGDRFNIIAFESEFQCFSKDPVPYNQASLDKADQWIKVLTDLGGTQIYDPLEYVLNGCGSLEGYDRILLLFTDGQVGNEEEIIRLVRNHNQSLSLYPFGIDTAVNKYFIDTLAEAGNGMPEYIYTGERIEDKVLRQFSRIHQPYIASPEIKGQDGCELEVVPKLPSKLHAFESYSFAIRVNDFKQLESLTICGKLAGEQFEQHVSFTVQGNERLLALRWAKEQIKRLENQLGSVNTRSDLAIEQEIIDLSLRFKLLSTRTSFVAVHKKMVKETGQTETIIVPVCLPRNWEMFDQPIVSFSCFKTMRVCQDDVMNYCHSSPIAMLERSEFISSEDMSSMDVNKKGVIHEIMRRAAEKQNADGTFGIGEDINRKTASFIIGMLSLKTDCYPYRIQIQKAGIALLTTGEDDRLLKAAALFLIQEAKIYNGNRMREKMENVIIGLTEPEQKILEYLINGELLPFLANAIHMELGEKDKSRAIIELLEQLAN